MQNDELSTLKAFGNASSALARLEERLQLSPVAEALRARLRFMEQGALAWIDGDILDVDAMALNFGRGARSIRRWPHRFAPMFGRPFPAGRPPVADDILKWLNVDGAEGNADERLWEIIDYRSRDAICEKVEAWRRKAEVAYDLPRLIAGADIARAWHAVSPLARGNTLASVMIGDRWAFGRTTLSSGGLVAIGLKATGKRWEISCGRDDDAAKGSRTIWLNAIVAAAQEGLGLEQRLRLYAQRVERHMSARRSSSRMPDLIKLAMRSPSITLPYTVETLGISKQAAHALLELASATSLLRETTGAASYRRYVAAA